MATTGRELLLAAVVRYQAEGRTEVATILEALAFADDDVEALTRKNGPPPWARRRVDAMKGGSIARGTTHAQAIRSLIALCERCLHRDRDHREYRVVAEETAEIVSARWPLSYEALEVPVSSSMSPPDVATREARILAELHAVRESSQGNAEMMAVRVLVGLGLSDAKARNAIKSVRVP